MAATGGRRWPTVLVAGLAAAVVLGALSAILVGTSGADGTGVSGNAPPSVPAQGAGTTTVELSADAAAHPMGEVVRATMQRHFDSINSRDYAGWASTVVPERVAQQPEADWRRNFQSTTDGSIRVSRIDRLGPGRLLLLVSFVSVQSPADAPPNLRVGRICWQAAFPMVGNPPLVDVGRAGSLRYNPC